MNNVPDSLRTALGHRYDVQRVIGRGGMATVYLARDAKHSRRVAIKVLRPELVVTLGVDRFLREIEIAAQLNHPHILPLLDSGDSESILYYVMPFVDGESLRGMLNRERPLSLDRTIPILREVADALSYAHRQGVVHRDIKPENILMSEGHAVVADFGIAKAISTAGGQALTRTGFPLGTPGYMSPEQAAGSVDLDERTDVFSLACVVYEMLVGEAPGIWPVEEEVRLGRFTEISPSHRARLDGCPGAVEQALTRAMAQRPRARFETPTAFADAVAQSTVGSKRYRDSEARDLIQRAAEIQAGSPTETEALSLGAIQQIAAEVGIPPDQVREAANLGLDHATERPAGVSARFSTKVGLERVIEHELSEAGYEGVLEEIRMVLGEVGRINPTLGKSLSWNSLSFQNSIEGSGRLTQVMVSPKNGRTTIRITESAGVHSLFAAAGVAAIGTAAFSILVSVPDIPGAVLIGAIAAACWASGFAARGLLRSFKARRDRILSDLMDRISLRVVREEMQLRESQEKPGDRKTPTSK